MIVKPRVRIEGWEQRVQLVLNNMLETTFMFGSSDCFQTFMSLEEAIYGSSLWSRYETYSDEEDARVRLRTRMRTPFMNRFLDRVYAQVVLEDLMIGDFSIQHFEYRLPRIYFFDGEQMVTHMPKNGYGHRYRKAEMFGEFWRL